uniref:Uncharacterized protein n=1 Tax=Rhizophora mucronata TaxID=61149 RepID=A0A2P2N420_RHIMU
MQCFGFFLLLDPETTYQRLILCRNFRKLETIFSLCGFLVGCNN